MSTDLREQNIMTQELDSFRPVILLGKYLTRRSIIRLQWLGAGVGFLGLAGTITTNLFLTTETLPLWVAFSILGFALWLEMTLVYAYYNYFYFRGTHSALGSGNKTPSRITFDGADCLLQDEQDVTKSFLTSPFGTALCVRLGMSAKETNKYIQSSRTHLVVKNALETIPTPINPVCLAEHLFTHDATLVQWLESNNVREHTWLGAATMVSNAREATRRKERWWSRDALAHKIPIGSELAYGESSFIQQYSRPLSRHTIFAGGNPGEDSILPYVTQMERIIASDRASNILLLGAMGVGKMDIVIALAERMRHGHSILGIHQFHIVSIDTSDIFASCSDPSACAQQLERLFLEAQATGNTILVFEDFGNFLAEASHLGIPVEHVLHEALALPGIHIIAIDTPSAFANHRPHYQTLVFHFSEVVISELDSEHTTRLLETLVPQEERRGNLRYTYSAIERLITVAQNHLTEGVMPHRAITACTQVTEYAIAHTIPVITPATVDTFVTEQTGIPLGAITEEERLQLLNLETILGHHVVQQPRAITAISKAMRRARADIERHTKPIASFLFIGPTGVGKTETAKALAATFFGSPETMLRLDMSEYATPEAVHWLIGDAHGTGTLTDALTHNPYCVLLLDEFEKADRSVHDLFLQILDEGFFTSRDGRKISARHCIIIATSNAGSDILFKTATWQDASPQLESEIITHIIKQQTFRPELINRFDATCLFTPLTPDSEILVAKKFLSDLSNRLLQRGYTIQFSDDVAPYVTQKGSQAQFGARSLSRFIQDVVEDYIAQGIIAGTITNNQPYVISAADLQAT